MTEPLGVRIRRARLARGMTQRQLARQASVARNTISLIERGLTPSPGTLQVQRIAEALDVPVGYLLGERDEIPVEGAAVGEEEAWTTAAYTTAPCEGHCETV